MGVRVLAVKRLLAGLSAVAAIWLFSPTPRTCRPIRQARPFAISGQASQQRGEHQRQRHAQMQ